MDTALMITNTITFFAVAIPIAIYVFNNNALILSNKRKVFYDLLNTKITTYMPSSDLTIFTNSINSVLATFPGNIKLEYAIQRYMRCVNNMLPPMEVDGLNSDGEIHKIKAVISSRLDYSELETSIVNILCILASECKLHYSEDKIRVFSSYKPNALITQNDVNQAVIELYKKAMNQ